MDGARFVAVARERPLVQDALLAAGLTVLEVVTALALVAPTAGPGVPSDAVIVVWAVLLVAPLAVRRRWPLTVMVLLTVHFVLYWAVGEVNEIGAWVALAIAVYSAAAHGRRPQAGWAFAGCTAGVGALAVVTGAAEGSSPAMVLAGLLFVSIPFALGWSLGSMTRQLREYRVQLQRRNAELAAERDARSQQAVLEERVRIARELHDVVAHHVSVMTVQAAAARRLFHSRPEDARHAIGAVEEAGRGAIVDLKQLVGVLRSDEPPDRSPQPQLADLPRLVAGVEQAGVPVALRFEGSERELPAGVQLSAYRIVQEALTNALKHSRASRVDVVVRYLEDAVEVDVRDDGAADAAVPWASGTQRAPDGKGLVGMRERVGAHGGTLVAGHGPDGGYRVHAVLRADGP